jgi:thioredoxin 1
MEKSLMRHGLKIFYVLTLVLLVSCTASEPGNAGEVVPGIPVKNTVTLVDLGATTCVPCKMMAPILEELQEEYKGRAEVIFIDVWDPANKAKAKAFKVMSIPTQIFFDKNGKETYRHMGFFDKKSMVAKLDGLLAQ